MIEKSIASALEPIVETIVALEKRVYSLQIQHGVDGKDADPAEVARVVFEKYADQLRGKDGDPGPAGANGADADAVEVDLDDVAKALKSDADFVASLRGEKGEPGSNASVDFSGLAKRLATALILKRVESSRV